MSTSEEFSFDASEFYGVARLFPLPNLVLFPHVVQPLHVFEERYRHMVEDALNGDRLIALAMLAPGWEQDYDGRPPLAPVACLGRIATHFRLDDGRYNLLLVGLRRVRLIEELPPTEQFRQAKVELLPDIYAAGQEAPRQAMKSRLLRAFKERVASVSQADEQLDQLLAGDVGLGVLTDVVGYTLDLDLAFKLRLLGEVDVDRRAAWLLERLETPAPDNITSAKRRYPPDFSQN